MEDIKIFENYQFGEIRVRKENDQIWFVAKDLCNALDISHYRDAVYRLDDGQKNILDVETNGGVQEMAVINGGGLKQLILKSRKPEAKIFAKKIGLGQMILSSKEQDTVETIINSIKNILEYKTQYCVGIYKIDLYLPELNIAIECDENGHTERNILKEAKRQIFIENKLDCDFIRFNPDETTFNIGKIINQIFKEVLKREPITRNV